VIEQVLFLGRELSQSGEKITNIVIMGMGEPFHNYDMVLEAIDRLNDPNGLNLGARRFTISTVGIVPGIRRFAAEKRQVNLAISLHAANDALRSMLIPANHKYPLSPLMEACGEYIKLTNRRLTFEWAMIKDVNDSVEHARELAALLKGLLCHVNIIPLNPTTSYNGKATTEERAQEFKQVLENNGIPCTIRARRGIDISAGCGQLAARRA
jgi:23S rRNA (adenine2503-C2)-methyltransferase